MSRSSLLLKVLMILLCFGWVTLWLLKPTELWTKEWKEAEAGAGTTVFGYYGLNFAVFTFPIIALASIGLVCLGLPSREPRRRQVKISSTTLSYPLVISSTFGVFSALEILAVLVFILFLAWTFYSRISNDFKKMLPVKTFKINSWQYKYFKVATRVGLLAEACLALLLLPILRGIPLFQFLGSQFEASVRYHTWLATIMLFFATIHGASNLFIWGINHVIDDEIWKWQKTGRIYLAGEITLITGLVIWITSLPKIRRKRFEIFYYVHHLYVVFLVFFLFHVGDRHFYWVFGGVFLFALDKLFRIVQSRPSTCLLSAQFFPCKTMELTFPKDRSLKYTPTSVVFMKIPSISKLQWHAFSITSSSSIDDQTMSVIIKSEGEWTSSLYNMIYAQIEESDASRRKCMCIPISIEGPYAPTSMDFLRYGNLILVSGGIGITPFLSILQEVAFSQRRIKCRVPVRIQLIHMVKKSQEISVLNTIFPLLLNRQMEQWSLSLKVFVTREQRINTNLRSLLNEFSETRVVTLDRGCSSYAVHGLESPFWMALIAGFASIVFFIFLILFNRALGPMASREKIASSVIDVIVMCSFTVAMAFCTLFAFILRWRKLRKGVPSISRNQNETKGLGSTEASGSLEECEVFFKGRPSLEDIIASFPNETGGADTGVLVCGPESLKRSIALFCRKSSQGLKMGSREKKPNFVFHSLNFTL